MAWLAPTVHLFGDQTTTPCTASPLYPLLPALRNLSRFVSPSCLSLSSGPLFPSSLSSPSIHPAHRSRPHPLFLRWSIVLIHLESTVTVVPTFCCWARSLVHSPLPDRAIEPGVSVLRPPVLGRGHLLAHTFLHTRSRLAQIVRVFKGKLGAYCQSRLRPPHAEPGLLALVETFEPRASTTFDRSTSWASFTRCWARLPF